MTNLLLGLLVLFLRFDAIQSDRHDEAWRNSLRASTPERSDCGQAFHKIPKSRIPVLPENGVVEEAIEPGEHSQPWMLSIRRAKVHICAGVLIPAKGTDGSDTLLAPAQCVKDIYDNDAVRAEFVVVAGGDYIFALAVSSTEVQANILSVGVYTNTKDGSLMMDLAVVKLETSIPFSDTIRPICLPEKNKQLPIGNGGMVVGWADVAVTDERKRPWRRTTRSRWVLQKDEGSAAPHWSSILLPKFTGTRAISLAPVRVQTSTSACRKVDRKFDSKNMFCTDYKYNDGGSAYIIYEDRDGKYVAVLHGIVSPRVEPTVGTLYTRIAPFRPWMTGKTNVMAKMAKA